MDVSRHQQVKAHGAEHRIPRQLANDDDAVSSVSTTQIDVERHGFVRLLRCPKPDETGDQESGHIRNVLHVTSCYSRFCRLVTARKVGDGNLDSKQHLSNPKPCVTLGHLIWLLSLWTS